MPVSSERLNVVAKLLRMLSFATGRTALANPAHPRSRGEHYLVDKRIVARFGSSPLARGTLTSILFAKANLGLIPARAGNTAVRRALSFACSAHPRSRGEHTPDCS